MKRNAWFGLIVLVFTTLWHSPAMAQDIHFSQLHQAPLFANPSFTGFYEGNWRFMNNYRNQWSAVGIPYQTISAGFDKPFEMERGILGLGIYFVNDESGSAALNINKLFLSIAYRFRIRYHQFSIGAQAGYVVQDFDITNLTFPSQYDENSGYFDNSIDNSISMWDENINYPDMNAGISWSLKRKDIKPLVGISVSHINTPEVSFMRENNQLGMRYSAYASLKAMMGEHWFIQPQLYGMYQNKAADFLAGSLIGYKFGVEQFLDDIYAGGEVRTILETTDAVAVIAGLGFWNIDLGLSYDINISGLRRATNLQGAFEISIVYTNFYEKINKIRIPCERF